MLSGMPNSGFCAKKNTLIFGVDEAGRGPLAGPVVAAAVLLGEQAPEGLADSKVLSAKKRAALEPQIRATCGWALGIVEVNEIDRINILAATMKAMTLATARLAKQMGFDPAKVLIDGNMTPHGRHPEWRWPAEAIVKGDASEPRISAASIIAKEHRDRLMREAAIAHPQYGWERNMGYGTAQHMEALRVYGPTEHHRRSFAPVAQLSLV